MVKGQCLCGAVRYEIEGPFTNLLHCHCSMCRKHHGSAFATFAAAPLAGYRITAGAGEIRRYDSSPGFHRSFCGNCGSVLPEAMEAIGLVIGPAGNLEGELGIEPQLHMFTGSKAPWYSITDGLPQFEEYPPEFGMSARPRPQPETRTGVTQGSCLCGEVAFEIEGEPFRMMNCHCSRCRRGRSAAHATNLYYNSGGFKWTRGESLVSEYKGPDAQYFTVAFCSRCGSALPRISPDFKLAVVPAGSLDTDPGMRPQAHIFVGSKAPWFRITDELPQFDEGPPRK
jgi:hypothetical protein